MLKLLTSVSLGMVLLAPTAWGKSLNRASKETVETVKFSKPTIVNGTTVEPARYLLVAKEDKLKVEDLAKKRTIAESPIAWKDSSHRFGKTSMDIDNGVLTKVNLGDTHESVLLHNS
jgi:hypothetical protein